MQTSWGPRIFWLVVFILAGLGIYAYFYDPADEDPRIGLSSPLANMVSVHPNVKGCDIYLGLQDQEPAEWKGEIKLTKGKILQLYPRQADPNSMLAGTRFECKTQLADGKLLPIILHVVYQADPDDSLSVRIDKETQKVPLADLQLGKPPLDAFAGRVRLQPKLPMQIYENDSAMDDHHPSLMQDDQGRQYLLYMNSERSKGIDVNSVLAGSFESLETPIVGTTLRLARFSEGSWQYSEAITPKLETCLDAVAAIDPTGRMFVVWIQKNLEGWDIYYQYKDFGTKGDSILSWTKPTKLTTKPGFYQHLVAATDSKGKVWLAWQGWQQDHFEIFAVVLNDDKHFMKMPGPIADHPQDIEGRWYPALAPDRLGSMYLAWSVFRQGRFDIEAVKLFENMVKTEPTQLVTSAKHALRPSLCCDKDNNLWVAYEESDPGRQFGDVSISASQIQIRTLRTDNTVCQWPAIPLPAKEMKTPEDAESKANARCIHPRLLLTADGLPIVVFEAHRNQYYTRWNESENGWTAAKLLTQWDADLPAPGQAVYQAGHVVGIHECVDWKGRVRLQFGEATEASTPVTMTKQTVPQVEIDTAPWKQFAEKARLFRRRSDELVLNKRYMLRGLVVLPGTVQEMAADPTSTTCLAYEQSMYDWLVVPQSPQAPLAGQWQTAQRTQVLTQQSDRNALLGYYRPLLGQREPLLLIDTKKDELPLVPLAQLESYRRGNEKATRISVSEATDRVITGQYVSQRQRLGFSLTDDWKMLPVLTQPTRSDSYGSENIDRMLLPLWHPDKMSAGKATKAVRVVAYAHGKSYDHLLSALRNRNFYTATDDIYLLVRCEKRLPGDVFQTSFRPAINVTVQGTTKLKYVEIWQDNKLVKSEEPPGQAAILEYIYEQSDRQWHSYTVRVVQENGTEAVAQSFWIKYLP